MKLRKQAKPEVKWLACVLIIVLLWAATGYYVQGRGITQYYVMDGKGQWFGSYRTVGVALTLIAKAAYAVSPNLIYFLPFLGLLAVMGIAHYIYEKQGFELAASFAAASPLYNEFMLQPIAMATFFGAAAYLQLKKSGIASGFLFGVATAFHLSVLSAGLWFLRGWAKVTIGLAAFVLLGFLLGYDHILYSLTSILDIMAFIWWNEDASSLNRYLVFSLPSFIMALWISHKSRMPEGILTALMLVILFALNVIVSLDRYIIPFLAFTMLVAKKGDYRRVLVFSIASSAVLLALKPVIYGLL